MEKATLDLFHEAKIQRRDTEKERLKWSEAAHTFWEDQYAKHGDDFSRQMMEAMFDLRSSIHSVVNHLNRRDVMVLPPAHLIFPRPFRA